MIPAAFDYEVAGSVDHAIELLGGSDGEGKLLAGGHSLLPLMKLRLATPALLVDIGRLDLRYVRATDGVLAIGALVRHEDLRTDPAVAAGCPLLAYAAGEIGDPQVRHRGTIGGSVAHGDPASDLPAVLRALDADFVVHGRAGDRTVAAADFFRGLFETALEPDEVLTEIRVPALPGAGWSYQKFRPRSQDWAIVGVAALVPAGAGLAGARVALANMGEVPLRATGVEEALGGGADPRTAAARVNDGTSPPDEVTASAEYRRALAEVLTRRALEEAAAR